MAAKSACSNRLWTKDNFEVSTDPTRIPIDELITIFDSDAFYWANALPEEAMREVVSSSLCFGLYDVAPGSSCSTTRILIGFARCVTDFTTFAYLTDVCTRPSYQGRGLGKWLMSCVLEITESLPHLRRTLLFTGDWERSVPFYEKSLGVSLMQSSHGNGLAILEKRGRGHPDYIAAKNGDH